MLLVLALQFWMMWCTHPKWSTICAVCHGWWMMDDGWKMTGDTKGIMMVKKGHKLVFDILVWSDTTLVYCLYINWMSNEIACPSITRRRPWSINDAHELVGHPGKDVTCEIVKGLNLNMQPGPMGTCWAWTVAKAKQKNVVQFSLHEHCQVPGERLFLDLSSIRAPVWVAAISNSSWIILVDESTNLKISHFFHRKDQMTEATCKLLKTWRDKVRVTKFMCMDNTGENKHSSRG